MTTISSAFRLNRISITAFAIMTSVGCGKGFQSVSPLGNSQLGSSSVQIEITSPAAGTSAQSQITLQGNCRTGIAVEVSGLGAAAPQSALCIDGKFSADVPFSAGDGLKNIVVTQSAGTSSVTSSSQYYYRDTQPPQLAALSPAADSWAQGSVRVSGICETGIMVMVNGTDISPAAGVNCNQGQFVADLFLTGSDGAKSISLSQTDAAGNAKSATLNVNKDTVAPSPTISSPAASAQVSNPLTISGACEGSFPVVISGSGLAADVTGACGGGQYSIPVTLSANDGSKELTVSQTDLASNKGSVSRTVTKVTPQAAPQIAITDPAADTVAKTGVTLKGTCVSGLTINLSGAGLASPSTATCSSGAFSVAITFSSGDGAKSITVSQTNSTGQSGSSSRSFIRDSTSPNLTISSPAANTVAKSGVTLTGACENSLPVQISGTGVASQTSALCNSGVYSSAIQFSSGDGSKAVTVSQTDSAGNSTSVSRTFLRDTASPGVTIASPAAGTSAETGLTIAGACENSLQVRISGSGVAAETMVSCSSGQYSAAISFSAGDGTKTVTVSQTDAAGNVGSASRDFKRVTYTQNIQTIEIAATDNVGVTKVEVFIDGNLLCTLTTPPPYKCSWPVTGNAGQVVTITAKAYDAKGNVGVSAPVKVTLQ